jgi:hypothetical protein
MTRSPSPNSWRSETLNVRWPEVAGRWADINLSVKGDALGPAPRTGLRAARCLRQTPCAGRGNRKIRWSPPRLWLAVNGPSFVRFVSRQIIDGDVSQSALMFLTLAHPTSPQLLRQFRQPPKSPPYVARFQRAEDKHVAGLSATGSAQRKIRAGRNLRNVSLWAILGHPETRKRVRAPVEAGAGGSSPEQPLPISLLRQRRQFCRD